MENEVSPSNPRGSLAHALSSGDHFSGSAWAKADFRRPGEAAWNPRDTNLFTTNPVLVAKNPGQHTRVNMGRAFRAGEGIAEVESAFLDLFLTKVAELAPGGGREADHWNVYLVGNMLRLVSCPGRDS